MSNKRITDLTELTTPTTDDVFPVVDIATNTTTKVQLGNLPVPTSVTTALATKQDTLVSGTNIKTVNSTSLVGSGNVAVQETLVSGTNIKTLNSTSLLGSGNIVLTANPSGVAGAIQFSNGSAFASDASNLFWDDTNNRLGVGTNAPTQTLDVRNTGTAAIFNVQNNAGGFSFGVDSAGGYGQAGTAGKGVAFYNNAGTSFLSISGSGGTGINILNPSAAFQIKGSGSTSATTSLLVQNSAGTQLFKVSDDGASTMQSLNLTTGGGSLMINGANVLDRGDGNRYGYQSGSQIHRFFTNSGTERLTILNDGSVGIGTNAPTQALDVVGQGRFSDNILFTTDFKHIGRDLNNSSISFASINSQIRAKISTGGVFEVYNAGIGQLRFQVSSGGQTTISGGGSTSATNSLLVQNSDGTNLLRVRDDGNVFCEGGGSISSVGIIGTVYGLFGGASYEPSASLVCGGTTQGFLPARMTTTQKNAIASPASGLVVYDSTTNKLCCYNGSTWNDLF